MGPEFLSEDAMAVSAFERAAPRSKKRHIAPPVKHRRMGHEVFIAVRVGEAPVRERQRIQGLDEFPGRIVNNFPVPAERDPFYPFETGFILISLHQLR